MKKYGIACVLVIFFAVCAFAAEKAHIRPQDVAGTPTDYCKVVKEPDPQLMGGWKCIWKRYEDKPHDYDINPVEYWLVKHGEKYALYFYRTKDSGRKKYIGWKKDWIINGKEITSDTGVKFFTDKGEVFFKWQQDKPIKMERIEGT